MNNRKRVAVFLGGRSPEHDVSVVSGLQVFQAIDTSKYDPFIVYITPNGEWYVGDALKERDNYIFTEEKLRMLTKVFLDLSATGKGILKPESGGFFSKAKDIEFDVALPIFHGLIGEDGSFQGLMQLANIPYAGMRAVSCNVFMDKDTTKKALSGLDIPQLPCVAIERPEGSLLVDEGDLKKLLEGFEFPCCVKPSHLGSSIGVGKAESLEDVRSILANIFKLDTKAIIEPFVENLVEYNVAVRRNREGVVETSSIERPKTDKELLDFKEKYMSGSGGKKTGGQKTSGNLSEGMLSLTREINPEIAEADATKILQIASKLFEAYDVGGAPRIDFISNGKTGEIWFNELNPIPGSYAYFLWEAAEQNLLFTDFLSDLIEESFYFHDRLQIPHDPVPKDAQLLKRVR